MTRATRLAIMISILAVAARFILIDQPYIDNWSWRQSDVAAIARNYFQGGFHFAHPQIDWAGDQPGYVGTEFPILPFLAALCYKIFAVHEWVGRVQAVFLFAFSLPFFFLLIRKLFDETSAIWALLYYSFAPVGIMASRCFMPDMPSLALSIIGLYFFERWIEAEPDWRSGSSSFFASGLCISLSILIKLPSAIIGAPLACLAVQRFGFSAFRSVRIWAFAAVALLPSAIWYRHAYEIASNFYPHHFFGAGGIKIMSAAWYLKIAKEIVTSTLTPILFVLGGVGAFITTSRSRARLFHWWLVAMILFVVIVGYGNRHQWYQLPLVPIAAAFAGHLCAQIMSLPRFARASSFVALFMRAGFSLVLIAFATCVLAYAKILYLPVAAPFRDSGLELNRVVPPEALIVAADNGDPTIFYYAARKGWHFLEKDGIYDGDPRDSGQGIVDLEGLRARGASYLVFTSNTVWWLDYYEQLRQHVEATSTLVEATSEFKIYQLNPFPK